MSTSDPIISELAPEFTPHPSFALSSTPFITSTFHNIKASASNSTLALNSSRILGNIPRWLGPLTDGFGWLQSGGSIVAEATGERAAGMETIARASTGAQAAAASAAAGDAAFDAPSTSAFRQALTFQHIRNFGGFFTYMMSKWALACFVLVSLHWKLVHRTGHSHTDPSGHPSQPNQDLYFRPPPSHLVSPHPTCLTDRAYPALPSSCPITPSSDAMSDMPQLLATQIRQCRQTL